jgi:hypothetical protein
MIDLLPLQLQLSRPADRTRSCTTTASSCVHGLYKVSTFLLGKQQPHLSSLILAMAAAFALFTAPAAFFGALASPSADAFKPALHRFSSPRVASTHEDTCNIVADNDQ